MTRRAVFVPLLLACFACTDDTPMQAGVVATIHDANRHRATDILLVIDDSASMHDQLELFAQNLPALGEAIETSDIAADVRVAITTTSVPGPTCAGPLARGGELLTDSCREAPPEAFVASAELDGASLDYASVCASVCELDSLELRLSPVDDYGDNLAERPWLDLGNNSYGGNLPEGVSAGEALACVGLRGIGGCEFESPIAAARRALAHMTTEGDPAYGFLRDDTPLLIVFIGDEDDCSHPDSSATIFDPEGERVFWSDPLAEAPSSAVCHAASTLCDADGCVPVDRDLSGAETDDPSAAVIDSLDALQAELVALAPEREVVVSMIGGVTSNGALVWPTSDDEAWIDAFGWGPGCTNPDDGRAQPPGRLHALITESYAFSICDYDWTGVLSDVVGWTGNDFITLHCGPSGVRDLDPDTPVLEPDCEILMRDAEREATPLVECTRGEDGTFVIDAQTNDYVVPAGADRCYVLRSDAEQLTADPTDDLDDTCGDRGSDVQLVVAAYPGAPPPPRDSTYEIVCAPAL